MKALVYEGPGDIRLRDHPDPRIEEVGDVVVKVELCAICGSDLHVFHGHGFGRETGFCIGHEAVGEIVEVGSGVRRLRVGDRVMISAAVGCGACPRCFAGDVARCETAPMRCYGLGSELEGCQAEAVRVPAADFNASLIPEGISATQALLLTDSLSTAWFACKNARVTPGDTVAVVGLGPIGLMAVEIAFLMGASSVFAIDPCADRRALAEGLGATVLVPETAVPSLADLTGGRRADCVVEAVGRDETIQAAIRLAARGGVVSVVGINQNAAFPFPMGYAMLKGLTFAIGACSVPQQWTDLVPLLQSGRLQPERFVSHVLTLSEGPQAYDLVDRRAEGALKVFMKPD